MTDIALLRDIASEFREKFETEDLSQAPGFLPGFPKGCCSWATWMIGHFLKYELEEDVLEIQAERVSDDGTDPHAWLVVDGVIVDIASDEFKDSAEKVIVTRDSQ